MSARVDETDEKIIRILQADSRRAFVEIANESQESS
jgi:DNA-binding Lrp family transcriptional regulator